MDEPTVAEELRALRRDVQTLITSQSLYVTQEQRTSDAKIFELQLAAVSGKLIEDRARIDRLVQWFWTALVGPVIVGVVLYFLLGGKP